MTSPISWLSLRMIWKFGVFLNPWSKIKVIAQMDSMLISFCILGMLLGRTLPKLLNFSLLLAVCLGKLMLLFLFLFLKAQIPLPWMTINLYLVAIPLTNVFPRLLLLDLSLCFLIWSLMLNLRLSHAGGLGTIFSLPKNSLEDIT